MAVHTQALKDIAGLMERVGEASELLYDPEAMTYFLAEITIDRMLPWAESAAQLRSQGAALLARDEPGGPDIQAVLSRVSLLEFQLDGLEVKLDAFRRNGGTVPEAQASAMALSRRFIAQARQSLGGDKAQRDAGAFLAAGSEAITAIVASQRSVVGQLSGLLRSREETLRRHRALALAGGGACAALLLGLALAIVRSTLRATSDVARALQSAAAGDLTQPLAVVGNDEFATMGRSVEHDARAPGHDGAHDPGRCPRCDADGHSAFR